MSSLRGFRQRLSTVTGLWDESHYDEALNEVESMLKSWPGNPHLHVLRACLIQLQEDPKLDLDEAKQALRQAIELDKSSPEASVELGHFLDCIEDDPQAAVKAYGDGVAAARHLLIDGLIGQAKACRQLERWDDFLHCLLDVLYLARVDSGSKTSNAREFLDLIVRFTSGHLKGPYAEPIQELLTELDRDRFTRSIRCN